MRSAQPEKFLRVSIQRWVGLILQTIQKPKFVQKHKHSGCLTGHSKRQGNSGVHNERNSFVVFKPVIENCTEEQEHIDAKQTSP